MQSTEATGAEDIHWKLDDLYPSEKDLDADLERAHGAARAFAKDFRGTIAALEPPQFRDALVRYEEILDPLGRAYTYAYLNWVTQTNDAERGALLQRVKEAYTSTHQELIFFDLEVSRLTPSRVEELLHSDSLSSYRHHLELVIRRRDHVLTEPEEKILSELDVPGRSSWTRLFDETLSALRFDLNGERLSEQEVLAKLHEPERDVRRAAALSFTDGLAGSIRSLTFIANTLLSDKSIKDRLRKYPHWLSSRNLDNEVADETVDALVQSVTSRYDLVERFYLLKRRLLGLDEMFDYDRYAPVGESGRRYHWEEAREVVLESYHGFHPEMGAITEQFFDRGWIDAALSEGKRGGAFSHGAVPSAHPYIMMNFTGRIRDVQTLAHELGHGVHQYLSRSQGILQADTPLTTAETASVFGEMVVFKQLLDGEPDPANRLSMIVSKIDDTIATVFRQIAMNRFEEAVHSERRGVGELSTDRFNELWLETQTAMFRGSVTLGDHYRYWWSYIPHFLHTPGYVYAYAFGELLVLALYDKYETEGPGFANDYMDLLRAGGSDWLTGAMARLGVDLTDLEFWSGGLNAIEALVNEAESMAGSLAI